MTPATILQPLPGFQQSATRSRIASHDLTTTLNYAINLNLQLLDDEPTRRECKTSQFPPKLPPTYRSPLAHQHTQNRPSCRPPASKPSSPSLSSSPWASSSSYSPAPYSRSTTRSSSSPPTCWLPCPTGSAADAPTLMTLRVPAPLCLTLVASLLGSLSSWELVCHRRIGVHLNILTFFQSPSCCSCAFRPYSNRGYGHVCRWWVVDLWDYYQL